MMGCSADQGCGSWRRRVEGRLKPTLSRAWHKLVVPYLRSGLLPHFIDEQTEAQRGLAASRGHTANKCGDRI